MSFVPLGSLLPLLATGKAYAVVPGRPIYGILGSRPPIDGPYWGSPLASSRRAIGTSSTVTTRATEPPRCGASHGGARPRTEYGRILSDPCDDPFRPRRPIGPQMLMNLGQRHKPPTGVIARARSRFSAVFGGSIIAHHLACTASDL